MPIRNIKRKPQPLVKKKALTPKRPLKLPRGKRPQMKRMPSSQLFSSGLRDASLVSFASINTTTMNKMSGFKITTSAVVFLLIVAVVFAFLYMYPPAYAVQTTTVAVTTLRSTATATTAQAAKTTQAAKQDDTAAWPTATSVAVYLVGAALGYYFGPRGLATLLLLALIMFFGAALLAYGYSRYLSASTSPANPPSNPLKPTVPPASGLNDETRSSYYGGLLLWFFGCLFTIVAMLMYSLVVGVSMLMFSFVAMLISVLYNVFYYEGAENSMRRSVFVAVLALLAYLRYGGIVAVVAAFYFFCLMLTTESPSVGKVTPDDNPLLPTALPTSSVPEPQPLTYMESLTSMLPLLPILTFFAIAPFMSWLPSFMPLIAVSVIAVAAYNQPSPKPAEQTLPSV